MSSQYIIVRNSQILNGRYQVILLVSSKYTGKWFRLFRISTAALLRGDRLAKASLALSSRSVGPNSRCFPREKPKCPTFDGLESFIESNLPARPLSPLFVSRKVTITPKRCLGGWSTLRSRISSRTRGILLLALSRILPPSLGQMDRVRNPFICLRR